AIFLRPLGTEPALVAHAFEPQACIFTGKLRVLTAPHHIAFCHAGAHRQRAIGLQPGTGVLPKLLDSAHESPLRLAPDRGRVRFLFLMDELQRWVRGMPRPNWAISSRWISLVPPPKVRVGAERNSNSSSPCNRVAAE